MAWHGMACFHTQTGLIVQGNPSSAQLLFLLTGTVNLPLALGDAIGRYMPEGRAWASLCCSGELERGNRLCQTTSSLSE
ncbi:hypothetical protein BDV12DRAFT_165080 [Aspergillus spectabilis]